MISFSSSFEAFNIPCLFTLAIILAVTFSITQKQRTKTAASNSPPGPWKLPVIGNIHQMIGEQPHRRLRDLARKYGPDVMRLQLGELPYIVISTPEAAKLVMKTHDVAFATRPYLLVADVLYYGRKDIALAPYGEHWRQMRKICTLELFSAKRVQSFRHVREEEVSNLVAGISRSADAGEPVDLTRMLLTLTSTITSRAAFGRVQELNDAFQMVVDNISDVCTGFKISDLYPSVKLLPVLTGYRAKLVEMRKAADSVLDRIIDEHNSRRRAGRKDDGEKEDLIDVLLNLQERHDLGIPITTEVIKAITLELFLAGTETSLAAMEWTMSEIIKSPRVLQKVQEEVRQTLGAEGGKDVGEASLQQLSYLDMVISEGLRLHPPLPLLLPRENREKVELDAYVVPSNTKVIVNAWAINRDPRHWLEPEKFHPERFLDCSTDYKGNDFHFIPFGAGRRVCPGISFAMVVVKLALANLLYHFRWELPSEMKQEGIDMAENYGTSLRRKNALRLIPTLYDGMA
ncbi:unnamed protein product [Linum trigynum]|uniref:Cytochrome P450 n=1 Tax=Linum trigynum TaxID=586398 RepID=A0AAV2C8B5_9ROSI